MTPDQPKAPLQQRIYQELADALTARLEAQELSWPAFLAAERRMRARVRLAIGRRLEMPDTHPSMADALTVLAGEIPEQAARDAALVSRWCHAHGIVVETTGARAWVDERLEQMAARERAYTLIAEDA
jgi:hypothetical protein